jgi:hypothetical protein
MFDSTIAPYSEDEVMVLVEALIGLIVNLMIYLVMYPMLLAFMGMGRFLQDAFSRIRRATHIPPGN